MIADMISKKKKKRNPVATKLLFRGGKLNISTVFIIYSYFQLPKD